MRDSLGFAGFVFLYINAGVFVEVSVFLSHGSRINVATFFQILSAQRQYDQPTVLSHELCKEQQSATWAKKVSKRKISLEGSYCVQIT